MKNAIILILTLFTTTVFSQTIEYTYDPAGNRVQRGVMMLAPPNADNALQAGAEETAKAAEEKTTIADGEVRIFPNPTDGEIQIVVGRTIESATVQLFDLSGKLLKEAPLRGMQHSLDLTNYVAGQYILIIQGRGYWQEWRIIKQ